MLQTTAPTGTRAGSPEANGHNGHEQSPFPDRSPVAAAELAAAATLEERRQRWRFRHYAVDNLPASQPWGRKLRYVTDRKNADRDLRYPPRLTFTGEQAVTAGATDAQIAALPELDTADIAELRIRAAAEHEAVRLRIREDARKLNATRTAADVPIPERVDLGAYEPEETQWVIDQMLARESVLGLFAERKAGKSTVVRELIRSALDGSPFLGRFAVSLPAGAEVVLFDTEMTLRSLHSQFHGVGVQNFDRLNLRTLRGRERALDARVDAVRARWSEHIAPGSLIVVDCLYSLFGALGISESSDEVATVLTGLRSLATECEAIGLVLVHHLGKDPDRGARGHSSIEGFPDVLARIVLDGPPAEDTPRVFSAYGRDDVSISAGLLTLGDDHRLTIGGNPAAERRAARHQVDDEAVWSLIQKHPGLSLRGLEQLPAEMRGKLSRDRIREAVGRLEVTNQIVNKGTGKAFQWHAITGADPFATAV